MDGKEFISRFLLYRNVIPNTSAVIFRKDAYLKTGGADPAIKYCSDWLTWSKILTLGKIFYSDRNYNNFREHDKSLISTILREEKFIKKYDLKMRKALSKFLGSDESNLKIINSNQELYKKELSMEKDFCKLNKENGKAFKYYLQLLLSK